MAGITVSGKSGLSGKAISAAPRPAFRQLLSRNRFIRPLCTASLISPFSCLGERFAPVASSSVSAEMEDQVHAGFGKKIPSKLYSILTVALNGAKKKQVGLRLSSTCVVKKVERGSVCDGGLQFGDLLLKIDENPVENRKHALEALKKITQNGQNEYKINFVVARVKTRFALEVTRLPRDYDSLGGFKYHEAVVYNLRGCRLGLPIKSYNNKVYVTRVMEYTLASLSLAQGDAIIDVEKQHVTGVEQTSTLFFDRLKTQGYVSVAIEQADDPAAAQYVRMALSTEKTVSSDIVIAHDVIDIMRGELRRIQSGEPRIQPVSILKESKPSKSKDAHTSFSSTAQIHPIASETNPKLLVHVYPLRMQNPLLITEGVVVPDKGAALDVTTNVQTGSAENIIDKVDEPILEKTRGLKDVTTDERTERNEQLSDGETNVSPRNSKTKNKGSGNILKT
ncbi:hypothetical protein L596_014647 [Steinernema carpocapsae]|uniref:PDZ domain-containing protein n=1 Tax=Steinernema carpocapsae TaxID=34508 RepID=A0A4U5ND09_STECR|nr:hypothetical protein L596_014647 [Steinernema carpocapsae]